MATLAPDGWTVAKVEWRGLTNKLGFRWAVIDPSGKEVAWHSTRRAARANIASRTGVAIRPALPQIGAVKRRYLKYIASCREAVMQRCINDDDAYKCEGCPRVFIRRPRVLAHHHVFGRGKIVAEPLASHPDFGAGLCRDCHREVHADPEGYKNRLLCMVALHRAWDTFGFQVAVVTEDADTGRLEPVLGTAFYRDDDMASINGLARSLERMLKDDGTWAVLREKAGL
jgi:hypothetical protein